MVKVINIDTKTRTIRVENAADGDIKTWRTTESGVHFPIKKGESTKEALDKFVEKKRPEAKKESGLDKDKIKAHKQGLIYYDDYAKQQSEKEEKARKAREKALKDKEDADFHEWQKSNPSKKADVSDIIKSYKEKMAALGPKASIKKTDRVEADAIKEFMTRKLGANRPYDDYYQYWLNGMDKKTRAEFEEIYNESEAREMAFSELASDVDHSGLARGEPTYDELMQWAEKQKAAKKEFDKELWDKAYEAAKKRVKGVKNPYPTHDDVQSMYEYMQSDDYKKSTEKASFKSAMQTTMKAFPRLYDFEKPHLEEFANKVYEDIQNNPGKEKEVLEHLADAYKRHIAGLGPWVDTPTLAKKAFLDQMLESHLNKQPKQSSQPTSYDLDDAFDEADLGSEWGRAKHRMDFHGVSQYTIKDIIDSGKYEAGDIIEALESNSHDKIDEMRKSLKDK